MVNKLSYCAAAAKAQHEPQPPWFLTSVTRSYVFQSKLGGDKYNEDKVSVAGEDKGNSNFYG
jgi:hypothetical protein